MDLRKQIDLYISNIFEFLELGEDVKNDSLELIRNSVLLKSFETAMDKKFTLEQKEKAEELIKNEDKDGLETLIKEEDLEHDISTQVQQQFINVLGELLIELNKEGLVSDEKLEKLIKALQDPEQQKEILPEITES